MSANKSVPHPNGTSVPNSLGTKVPHPHAESMLLYAQDAMETSHPWERWQFKHESETNWRSDAGANFGWLVNHDYRRKPRIILINGIEVPEPVREVLSVNQTFYYPCLDREDLVQKDSWFCYEEDQQKLERGMIHLTEENARKHAEALLSFTKK